MTAQRFVKARLDSSIWLDRREVPDRVIEHLKNALTLPNPEFESARREETYGWEDIPQNLVLYAEVGDIILIPRGFAQVLKKGLAAADITIAYQDERIEVPGKHGDWRPLESPRDGQPEAIGELLRHQQGIIEATPGWGKTVMMLETIRQSGQKAIVIVDKTNIMTQWKKRAYQHFGASAGVIGGGMWDEQDLTIAMKHTLWSRRKELDESGFFDKWGLVVMDECHHASAESYSRIMSMFSAKFRCGLSATPDKKDGTDKLIVYTIGEILYRPGKEKLREAGQLIKPKVVRVPTPFDFDFKPTRRIGGTLIRNNYTKMMGALIEHNPRNQIIGQNLERGKKHLVVSDRLNHLDRIAKIAKLNGWPEENILFLTGREDNDKRDEVEGHVHDLDECIVLSTIAKEAVDIPPLEVIHLAWPVRQTHILKQTIGRVERGHPGKDSATVYDYYDPKISVLRSQSKDRAAYYRTEDLEVETQETGSPRSSLLSR